MIKPRSVENHGDRKPSQTSADTRTNRRRNHGIPQDTTVNLQGFEKTKVIGGVSPVTGDATLTGLTSNRSMHHFDRDWKPGMQIQNEFIVERLLGSGGMGHVFLVRRLSDAQLYAMKTVHAAKLTRSEQRHMFFREIRTWIDLPEHPNLVKCRFVRMLKNRPLVFSDYIDGGTLMDRIETDAFADIGSILDMAVQSAWGLQAAHHAGVIHQDIKPANILLTADGIPKITDFGIAKAVRSRMTGAPGDKAAAGHASENRMVSSDGMTIAYCSPEQARRQPLDHRTDIWSWGITILQIFSGDLPWVCGAFIRSILEQVIRTPPESTRHRLPEQLAQILDRCFQEDPADRWRSFSEVSEALIGIYPVLTGKDFHLGRPVLPEVKAHPENHHRISSYGGGWRNPAEWFERVMQLTGRAIPVLASHGDAHGGSLTSRNLKDIELLESAEKIYRHLIVSGQSDLIDEYAGLKHDMASLYESIGDYKSAIELYNSILPLYRKIAGFEPCPKSFYNLAQASLYRGAAQYALSLFNDAAASFSEAIRGFSGILTSGYRDSDKRLLYAYMNRGSVFNQLNAAAKQSTPGLSGRSRSVQAIRGSGDRPNRPGTCLDPDKSGIAAP